MLINTRQKHYKIKFYKSAFTIVELLVVVVVIGILATITIISYMGIRDRAIVSTITSDLNDNSKLLELYKIEHESYPTSLDENNCPVTPEVDGQYCLIASNDNDIDYEGTESTYTLIITHDDISYSIDNTGSISEVDNSTSGDTFVNVYAIGGEDLDKFNGIYTNGDGSYAVAGFTYSYGAGSVDSLIAKYDSSGNVEWNKTWGGQANDFAFGLTATSDEGYVVIGYTYNYGVYGASDGFIIKYDSSGNVEWNKTWGGSSSDSIESIVQTSDGGYVAVGTTGSYGAGGSDSLIIKYDSSGNVEWNKTWGGSGSDYARSIVQTDDGGYIVVGNTYSYTVGSADVFIIKYDSSGNVEWNKTWGGSGNDAAYSALATNDGGFISVGFTYSYGAGGADSLIAKYDSSGNVEWNKTWGGSGNDYARSIVQTDDNGYIIVGYTDSYGAGYTDILMVKYDSSGNVEWNTTWGGEGIERSEYSNGIGQSNSSYIIVGYTDSYGAGDTDGFILNLSSDGTLDNCSTSMCMTPSATITTPSATITTPSATVRTPVATITSPSDPTVTSPTMTITRISPPPPPPPPPPVLPPTVTFSSQELYVAYPGEDQIACKEWSATGGNTIKAFYVTQETEEDYDYFIVSADGLEVYNKSGYLTDEYVYLDDSATTLEACMSADESYQEGFGGEVTGVAY